MRSYIIARVTFGLAVLVMASFVAGRERGDGKYAPFPAPDAGYVTDLADVLSEAQEQQLERWLQRTEERSGVEIVVVTIASVRDYPGAPQRDVVRFARALFDAYEVGDPPRNRGVLLLVASRDGPAWIQLGGGYSRAEKHAAMRIMASKLFPRAYKGEYAQSILHATRALMREFGGVYLLPDWAPWALGGIGLAMIPVAISLFRNGKRGWGWIVVGLMLVLVLVFVWLCRRLIEGIGDAHSEPGGLDSYGGGFYGGGGAAGRW